jgi:hypothetical protein
MEHGVRGKLAKLAAAAAVAASIVAVPITSASAAASSITVTTLGRDGAKVSTTVDVVGMVDDDPFGPSFTTTSGKTLAVPAGTYS